MFEYDKAYMAKRLRQLRGSRTLEEIACAAGISVSSLEQYEQGIRVPNDALKLRLAQLLEVELEDIFVRVNDQSISSV